MMKNKIVLIEDDSFLSNMYETKLKLAKYQVFKAADGESGITLITQIQPDLVLLDILLPKQDGWEVLRQLKNRPETKQIPVILLTNLGQEDDVKRGLALGAVDYLIKAHFIPQEVIDKIRKILALEAARDPEKLKALMT